MKNSLIFTIVLASLLLSIINCIQNKTQKDFPTFQQFKERFKKTYATKEQQQYRKSVYNANRKSVIQNTECKDCGINVFCDTTADQRKVQLFGLEVPQNLPQLVAESRHKVRSKLRETAISYPTSLDWRQKKAVSKVRNQGSCGSCWAFEMVAAAESLLLIQGKANATTIDLAQQGLLQCTSGSTCNGGYPSRAAQLIVKNGLFNESRYPYRPSSFYQGTICSAKGDVQSIATASNNYYGVSDNDIIELLQVSPIGVTLDADSLSSRYDPTKNPVHKCSVGDNQINHGVLLVGYTPTYWIIKNSWGTKWGIDGFAYISRNRANNENCVIHTWITTLQVNCTVPNCNQCSSSQSNSCSICKAGYYISPNGSLNQCKQCLDTNCQTCYTRQQNAALQGRCKICKKGFSLQASTQTCKSTQKVKIDNCLVHSEDYNTCLTCDDGYVSSSDASKCLKCNVENCDQCLSGYQERCKSCKPGYTGQQCHMICSDKCVGGCSAPGLCTKCMDGYTGKNCEVVVCLDNCLSCQTPYTCDVCQQGYNLPNCEPSAKPTNQCSSKVMNCAKGCSKDPDICDECDKDFYGPKCNIQYICDSQTCRTVIFQSNKLSLQTDTYGQFYPRTQEVGEVGDTTATIESYNQEKQTGLLIGLIVVSILFVFTIGFAGFLFYRLRAAKRLNVIQAVDSQGSNKSIPYVGKNISV